MSFVPSSPGFTHVDILILAQGLDFKTFVHHLPFRVLHFNRLSAEVVVSQFKGPFRAVAEHPTSA